MPKLTSLLLAVLLICLTLNFCTKNNGPTAIDISGTYMDTITIGRFTPNIRDTIIIKKVIKVDDTTYKMIRYFDLYYPYGFQGACDSVLLHLKQNNTIVMEEFADKSLCIAFFNVSPYYGLFNGVGYYDPSQQYLYLYHTIFEFQNSVMPLPPIGVTLSGRCDQCSSERMKKQ